MGCRSCVPLGLTVQRCRRTQPPCSVHHTAVLQHGAVSKSPPPVQQPRSDPRGVARAPHPCDTTTHSQRRLYCCNHPNHSAPATMLQRSVFRVCQLLGWPGGVPQLQAAVAQITRRSVATSNDSVDQQQQERARMVNKLLYRSRQRGFLELDLLVGLWAEQELPRMPLPMLQAYSVVLDQENPDLFKWLTGQTEAPPELQANQAYQALRQHVARQLQDSCHAGAQAAPGKEWLRGWDDSWRGAAAPPIAGQQQQGDAQPSSQPT